MAVVANQAVAFDKSMLPACRRSATLSEWLATRKFDESSLGNLKLAVSRSSRSELLNLSRPVIADIQPVPQTLIRGAMLLSPSRM
jgi:hypothetical protein